MKVTIEYPLYLIDQYGDEKEFVYEIECELTPEDKGCWTLPNGDPGYPGSPAECEILSVKLDGKEIKNPENLFDDGDRKQIEENAFQKASDDEEGAAEDHADAERERRMERD